MVYPEYEYNEEKPFDPDGDNVLSREEIPHEASTDIRSQLRRVVLQILYQLDSHDHSPADVLDSHMVYDLDGGTVQDSQPLLDEFLRNLQLAADPEHRYEAPFINKIIEYDEHERKAQRTRKDLLRLLENVAGYLSSNNNEALQAGLERYITTLAASIKIYTSGWLPDLDRIQSKTIAIGLYVMGIERRFHLAATVPPSHVDTTAALVQLTDRAFTGWHEIGRMVYGISEQKMQMDDVLQLYAPDYPLEQIAIIDRNILRLALYELISETVPLSVAISEAVLLGKYFGADGTSRFVNGVLGAIAPNIDEIRETLSLLSS